MKIQEMFVKDINRDIKGVIKVGQDEDANVKQELEEYVVTHELQGYFRDFFTAYKKGITGNTDKMGVWISGFFGSGKSHFLKILSYLLSNKEVAGKKAIDYFKEDNKIADSMVLADMELAANTSTDAILFNVDSKGSLAGKHDKDAIVSVFLKVFNEMQGFYGGNAHIADFERKLAYDGRFEEFKQKFAEKTGESWLEARNEFDYNQDEAVETIVDMGIMSEEAARNWCEKVFTTYAISIEDFSKMVKKYIDKKGKNHHVVFLVDEVGQYIGEDSRLMLNLQTITEDLGTACQGKAWIIVTSQQNIDSVIKVKGNDFSKITGRFDTRISLSSANVDEVIRKRILEKKPLATQTLSLLYDDKATIIKNLVLFNDEIEKKLYKNAASFSEDYPFVPYQFNLLGDVLTAIRTHGAAGKSLADGERSMLALFKESAMQIENNEQGALVPFHMFYDALARFVDSSHSSVIIRAKDNEFINPDHEENNFRVNVLKVLFMIKYVKTIKANAENIASLMVKDISDDRIKLVEDVNEALKVLVKQALVQKINDEYVFLTNEEQEINNAIQNQVIDSAEVTNKIAELIFEGIFDEKKYHYPKFGNRYAFSYNQMVDDRPLKGNVGNDLTLRVLTPNSEEGTDETTLRLLSGQNPTALVVLADDRAFIDELSNSLKIERFLRFDPTSNNPKYEEIKNAKVTEMREHKDRAKTFLEDALKNADIYVNGDKLHSSSKEIKSKINEALGKLVDTVYHKLPYITAPMSEADIRSLIKSNDNQISLEIKKTENELALNDLRDFISNNTLRHTKTSMKTLMDRFLKAPYGFIEDDVKWLVAKLFKDGDIALFINSEPVTIFNKTDEEIVKYITRKENYEKLMAEKKERPDEKQIKAVKRVMKELFHVATAAEDDDPLMKSFLEYAKSMKLALEKLDIYYSQQPKYPGKKVINEGRKLLLAALGTKFTNEFFKQVFEDTDAYLDFAEEYESVRKFFEGDQKVLFDKSLDLVDVYDDSKSFITRKDISEAAKEIKKILSMEDPYSSIYKLPECNQKFISLYGEMLDKMLEPVQKEIAQAKERVLEKLKGKKCEEDFRKKVLDNFSELSVKAEQCKNVAKLQSIRVEADALKVRWMNEIDAAEPTVSADPGNLSEPNPNIIKDGPNQPAPVAKRYKTVSMKSFGPSWQIETEKDLDDCLKELRRQLLLTLEENTITNIEF